MDLRLRLDESEYRRALLEAQLQLRELAWRMYREQRSAVIVYEGWDAAGKGGNIRHDGEPVPQTWIVGDVEECVEQLHSFIGDFGITDIVSMAAPPGLRLEQMVESLEKLFGEVVPKLKKLRQSA